MSSSSRRGEIGAPHGDCQRFRTSPVYTSTFQLLARTLVGLYSERQVGSDFDLTSTASSGICRKQMKSEILKFQGWRMDDTLKRIWQCAPRKKMKIHLHHFDACRMQRIEREAAEVTGHGTSIRKGPSTPGLDRFPSDLGRTLSWWIEATEAWLRLPSLHSFDHGISLLESRISNTGYGVVSRSSLIDPRGICCSIKFGNAYADSAVRSSERFLAKLA